MHLERSCSESQLRTASPLLLPQFRLSRARQSGVGNLAVTYCYGSKKVQHMPLCWACKVRFSGSRGEPLYDFHLLLEEAISVLDHITEGKGFLISSGSPASIGRPSLTTLDKLE